MATFMERMQVRRRLWWGAVGGRPALHRLGELVVRRHRADADDRWHCCDAWPRRLANKWNGRELAARHGVRVPALFWFGRRPGAIPFDALPPQFVVRPVHGAGGRGVHVVAGDRELLGVRALPRAALRPLIVGALGRVTRWPLLVEEFARREDGSVRLPTEYKCYAFAGTVGVIQVVDRRRRNDARHRFYLPDWTPIDDDFQTDNAPAPPADPPRCLDEILRAARVLGAACGTFMRVDCFATPAGCVFDEVATTPNHGAGFTPHADALLGELWQRIIPDRV
ncbi:MAG: ATP-grasp fold amidoligase family protein [Candidatus Binatia bacterium]